ncbi:heme-degrading domain-containing protein [Agrococcus jejuensis]|uniref:heme-degrading domain-containing protein n=1 Tax=Agrococcus jejuensis TaxID=399736 RepID=UPI001C92F9F7|nr:heme-degrading domain-containing protein [Agrococcus jejuensis]
MSHEDMPPHGSDELRAIVERDEAELVFERFDLGDAWRLGVMLREAALDRELPVVIGIVVNGQRVFHAALPGTTPENDRWLERKTNVVLHFQRSSLGVGERFRARGQDFAEARLDPATHAAHGGVLPIAVRGAGVVGAVGVSGLPQLEDHAFVASIVRTYLAAPRG